LVPCGGVSIGKSFWARKSIAFFLFIFEVLWGT
jgi:hypothetical protein